MTALNNQTLGQPLTLECQVTAARGITSRVDIAWGSNDTTLSRTNDITAVNNSLVYTDFYHISQLSTTDDGRIILCGVLIYASPLIVAAGNITLNVMGM